MPVDAKICGLTRAEDAALAAAHGAWRLGVVFASGPRVVTVTQARDIVAASGGVPVLGVFGSQPLRTMLETMRFAGLAGAQLHGKHPEGMGRALRSEGFEVWRVVPIGADSNLADTLAGAADDVDAVLLEARHAGGAGGKGIPVPLELARAARNALPGVRIVLAGGLTADSVREAIRVVGPDAVDVSSGIEISPGIKDGERLVRFLENVIDARSAA